MYFILLNLSIGSFFLITYLGVFIYLLNIYRNWRETTIGFWTIGSLFIASSVLLFIASFEDAIFSSRSTELLMFKLALSMSFLGFWSFGISHLIARRNFLDVVGFSSLTLVLGLILEFIFSNRFDHTRDEGIIIENSDNFFSPLDMLLIPFFIILYLLLSMDAENIYRASKSNKFKDYSKATAWSHLLAWQFWVVGILIVKVFFRNLSSFEYYLPILFLLVPLITLGSRPFDWVREGFEPVLILLIDEHGNPVFSWTLDSSAPLLMEGSTVSTTIKLLSDFVKDPVANMNVNFMNASLFVESSLGYNSILITTGYHRSFERLLKQIHSVLVTAVVGATEFGIPGYELPRELKWLLRQLLPDVTEIDYRNDLRTISGQKDLTL